jgi:hypothetical protein
VKAEVKAPAVKKEASEDKDAKENKTAGTKKAAPKRGKAADDGKDAAAKKPREKKEFDMPGQTRETPPEVGKVIHMARQQLFIRWCAAEVSAVAHKTDVHVAPCLLVNRLTPCASSTHLFYNSGQTVIWPRNGVHVSHVADAALRSKVSRLAQPADCTWACLLWCRCLQHGLLEADEAEAYMKELAGRKGSGTLGAK